MVPISRLHPYIILALRTMTREPLVREGNGWTPGYACPAGDRGFLPHNHVTIQWMHDAGLCRITGARAVLTSEGRAALNAIDGLGVAA